MTCINKFDLRVLIMEQIITKHVSPINLFVICMLAKPAGAKVAVLLFQLKETKENNNVLLIVVQLVN